MCLVGSWMLAWLGLLLGCLGAVDVTPSLFSRVGPQAPFDCGELEVVRLQEGIGLEAVEAGLLEGGARMGELRGRYFERELARVGEQYRQEYCDYMACADGLGELRGAFLRGANGYTERLAVLEGKLAELREQRQDALYHPVYKALVLDAGHDPLFMFPAVKGTLGTISAAGRLAVRGGSGVRSAAGGVLRRVRGAGTGGGMVRRSGQSAWTTSRGVIKMRGYGSYTGRYVRNHEKVHRFLTPGVGIPSTSMSWFMRFRQRANVGAYNRSWLFRWAEEGLAEGYAVFKHTGSLRAAIGKGATWAKRGGYLSRSEGYTGLIFQGYAGVAAEAGLAIGGIGGLSWGAYELSDSIFGQ